MTHHEQWIAEAPQRLQRLNQFGRNNQLSHAVRNQLNALSLALQTLQLQSQLKRPLDTVLLSESQSQWQQFEQLEIKASRTA